MVKRTTYKRKRNDTEEQDHEGIDTNDYITTTIGKTRYDCIKRMIVQVHH